MRVGIRTKMVSLLAAVAVLPLMAGLLVMVIEGHRLETELFGKSMQAVVAAEAREMRFSLRRDIENIIVTFEQDPDVLGDLGSRRRKLPDKRLKELDRVWPTMPASRRPMSDVLNHRAATLAKIHLMADPHVVEVLLTDRFGQLLAATGRTSNFYQADEAWWQATYRKGKGRVHVTEVSWDDSAKVDSLS
ncbi:hypothetical protein LCGC14_3135860, partial [marine sediment metagenome]